MPNKALVSDHVSSAVDGPSGFDPSRIGDLPERLFAHSLELLDGLPQKFVGEVHDAAGMLAEIRNGAGVRP